MAITIVKLGENVFGNQRHVWGTATISGGATGGDITTGLHSVHSIQLTAMGSSIVADAPTVNETLPCTGDVTIIATKDTAMIWDAFGD
jgi:hypothetical protein